MISTFYDERLPALLKEHTSQFNAGHVKGLRKDLGVDVRKHEGIEYLICDGYCSEHSDWKEISVLWVVRNDSKSWVWSRNKRIVKEQPIGTVVVLDIDHIHGLNCVGKSRGEVGVWIAAIVARLEEWPSQEKLKSCLDDFIKEPKTLNEGGFM